MRRLVAAFVAVMVLLAGLYAASPFWGFYQLEQAARAGDQDGLEAVVDFPAVREDLKAQVNAGLLGKAGRHNGFAALGLLLATALVDKLVDSYLTPQAIAVMVTRAQAPKPGEAEQGTPPPKLDHSYGYTGLDRFRVTLADHARPDWPLAFVMERRGLFGWKLIRIELPPRLWR